MQLLQFNIEIKYYFNFKEISFDKKELIYY